MLFWMLVECAHTVFAAEVIGRALMLGQSGSILFLDLHTADRIDMTCHSSPPLKMSGTLRAKEHAILFGGIPMANSTQA